MSKVLLAIAEAITLVVVVYGLTAAFSQLLCEQFAYCNISKIITNFTVLNAVT